MAKYIVTGAVGFLGTNLCKRLIDDGHKVIGIDNMYSAMPRNLDYLKTLKGFEFINHDICQAFPSELRNDKEIVGVYNLACPASPPRYQKDPIYTWKTSVLGALNCVEFVRETGARLFHTSTSEVYGNPLEHPQSESYWGNVNPVGIRSCYDEGKRAAETLLIDFHRMEKHPVKIVRIFNTYGPHMDPEDGRVVSNFILQALGDEPITVYGDGKQTRSFCYVDDLIEGFVRFMNSDDDFVGPCNMGNPGEFTMLELADLIFDKIDTKSERIHKELPKDDPVKRRPNISLAKEMLGWEPQVPLSEGLDKTIEYYRNIK